jgi:hypothetical protein
MVLSHQCGLPVTWVSGCRFGDEACHSVLLFKLLGRQAFQHVGPQRQRWLLGSPPRLVAPVARKEGGIFPSWIGSLSPCCSPSHPDTPNVTFYMNVCSDKTGISIAWKEPIHRSMREKKGTMFSSLSSQ